MKLSAIPKISDFIFAKQADDGQENVIGKNELLQCSSSCAARYIYSS